MLEKHSSPLCNKEKSVTLGQQLTFAEKKPFKAKKKSIQKSLVLQALLIHRHNLRSYAKAIQTQGSRVLIIISPSHE